MEGNRNRRTPASVILVVVALVVAAAGSAIAAGQSDTGRAGSDAAAALTKQQVKKIAKKVAKREIRKAAPTLSVAHATTADSATRAGTANTATTAASANLLNGFAASDLARATTATAGNLDDPCVEEDDDPIAAIFENFANATFTTAVSKAVTAPKSGVLLVLGSTTAERASGGPAGEARLRSRITVDGLAFGAVTEELLDDSAIVTCQDGQTLTVQAVVPVSTGTHTVAVQIARSHGAAWAFVGNATVSTLYVPFGNAGTQGVVGATSTGGQAVGSNR